MMNQFRIERNQYGNMFIYCRNIYYRQCIYLERLIAIKQYNQQTNQWE